jgi:hypothetical protein
MRCGAGGHENPCFAASEIAFSAGFIPLSMRKRRLGVAKRRSSSCDGVAFVLRKDSNRNAFTILSQNNVRGGALQGVDCECVVKTPIFAGFDETPGSIKNSQVSQHVFSTIFICYFLDSSVVWHHGIRVLILSHCRFSPSPKVMHH